MELPPPKKKVKTILFFIKKIFFLTLCESLLCFSHFFFLFFFFFGLRPLFSASEKPHTRQKEIISFHLMAFYLKKNKKRRRPFKKNELPCKKKGKNSIFVFVFFCFEELRGNSKRRPAFFFCFFLCFFLFFLKKKTATSISKGWGVEWGVVGVTAGVVELLFFSFCVFLLFCFLFFHKKSKEQLQHQRAGGRAGGRGG